MEYKAVEEVFVDTAAIVNLHVGGEIIETTSKHPFYSVGRGWVEAGSLQIGDLLMTRDGESLVVHGVAPSGAVETVYNFRIAEYHTYFVSPTVRANSSWAHNACNLNADGATSRFGIYEIEGLRRNLWVRWRGVNQERRPRRRKKSASRRDLGYG